MNDENAIVQQLADKLPAHVPLVGDYPAPQPEPNANNNFVDKMLPEERLTQMQLMDYLSIPTASAPAYVKGGMYFDTTLSKLRVGGSAGWETVTSV